MGSSTAAQMYPPSQMQTPPQYQGHLGYPNPYQSASMPSFNHHVPSYGQVPTSAQPQLPGQQQPPPQQQQQQQQSYPYDNCSSNGLKRPSDEALQPVDLYSKRPRPDSVRTVAFYPQRPGERLCSFYMTTRTCSFGVTCRFDHPAWVPFGGIPNWKEVTASGSAPAATDLANLPQRPGEPNCSFYMKRGDCKYGQRCKFHHPKDRRASSSDSAGSSKEEGVQGVQMGTTTKTIGAGANGNSGMNGPPVNSGITATNTSKTTTVTPSMKGHSSGERTSVKQAPLNSKGLPLRPGENECTFYVKTGSCKYGATCRFNHPEITKPDRRTAPQMPTQKHQSPNVIAQMSYATGSFPSQMQSPNMGPQMTYATADMKVSDTQAVGAAYYQQWPGQPVPAETKLSEMTGVSLSSYQQQWQTAPVQAETKASDSSALKMPSYTQHWQYPSSVQAEMKVSDPTNALTSQYQQHWSCLPLQTDTRVHDASPLGTSSIQQQWQSMPMPVPVQAVSYADATATLAASQFQQQWQCPPVHSDTRVNEASGLTLGTASYQQHLQCPLAQADLTVSPGQVTGTAPFQWQYLPPQANVKIGEGTPLLMSQYQQQWTYMPEQTPVKEALSVDTPPTVKVDMSGLNYAGPPPGGAMLSICPYPQRPGDPDCSVVGVVFITMAVLTAIYYLKTGECSFGASCKFHHPPGRVPSIPRVAPKLTLAGLPRREGETMCAYYLKTGACKYGSTCRFDHPPPGEAAAKLAAEPVKLERVDSEATDTPEIQEPKQTTNQPENTMQYVDLNLPMKPDDEDEVKYELSYR